MNIDAIKTILVRALVFTGTAVFSLAIMNSLPGVREQRQRSFARATMDGNGESNIGTAQDDMWSAGVGVMLPIGTGARQGAEAAEAAAMAAASEAERRDATLELQSELVSLRAQAAASRRTIALLTDTVLVAQKRSLAASWSAYEAGAADLADVLDAAHASYSVELEASRAHQELAGALARLLAVTARPDLVGVRVPPSGADRRKP